MPNPESRIPYPESRLDLLNFEKQGGLLPVVAQHARTGEVLMLAWANREALERTLETGELWYWSRSRARLWKKGESSGNVQRLVSLHADCDADALVALVEPTGPSCHTGEWSCFDAPPTLPALERVLAERAAERPENSYTTRLLANRNLRLKKLGEEAVELALACSVGRTGARARGGSGEGVEGGEVGGGGAIAEEAADLIYHALVAALGEGVGVGEVLAALDRRLPGRE